MMATWVKKDALFRWWQWLFCVTLLIVSCAPGLQRTPPTEDSLLSVVTTYWKNRLDGEIAKNYDLEDKETRPKTLDEYIDRAGAIRKFAIAKFEIVNVEVKEDLGFVDVAVYYYVPISAEPFKQVLHDKWQYIDGRWTRRFEF